MAISPDRSDMHQMLSLDGGKGVIVVSGNFFEVFELAHKTERQEATLTAVGGSAPSPFTVPTSP
jgi:hypothetical protein